MLREISHIRGPVEEQRCDVVSKKCYVSVPVGDVAENICGSQSSQTCRQMGSRNEGIDTLLLAHVNTERHIFLATTIIEATDIGKRLGPSTSMSAR